MTTPPKPETPVPFPWKPDADADLCRFCGSGCVYVVTLKPGYGFCDDCGRYYPLPTRKP